MIFVSRDTCHLHPINALLWIPMYVFIFPKKFYFAPLVLTAFIAIVGSLERRFSSYAAAMTTKSWLRRVARLVRIKCGLLNLRGLIPVPISFVWLGKGFCVRVGTSGITGFERGRGRSSSGEWIMGSNEEGWDPREWGRWLWERDEVPCVREDECRNVEEICQVHRLHRHMCGKMISLAIRGVWRRRTLDNCERLRFSRIHNGRNRWVRKMF